MTRLFLIAILSASAILSSSIVSSAQENCGTDQYTQHVLTEYPEFQSGYDALLQDFDLTDRDNGDLASIITIPVVFHVVYGSALENISDQQLQEAVLVLNRDFRRTNADASFTQPYHNLLSPYTCYPADSEIEFCIKGVYRVATNFGPFGMTDAVKSASPAYQTASHLNVWVCNIGNDLLGYATFPNTSPAHLDGVVIDYRYTGLSGTSDPNYQGRTITHEVGHWLNLFHIWGNPNPQNGEPTVYGYDFGYLMGYNCFDDYVSDTWPQHRANPWGCPFDRTNCPNIPGFGIFNHNPYDQVWGYYGYLPMNDNFMDYTAGSCANFFSSGQKQRMRTSISQFRPQLLGASCSGNVSVEELVHEPTVTVHPNPTTDELKVTFSGTWPTMIRVIGMDGRILFEQAFTEVIDVRHLPTGVFLLEVAHPDRVVRTRFVKS